MKTNTYLWLIVLLDLCCIIYGASGLSISYKEALVLYELQTPLHYVVKFSCDFFGYNDFALRAPFVVFHLANIVLLYGICKDFFKRQSDILFCMIVYMLLPGVNAAALLVNEASFSIFMTLLFVWTWQRGMFIVSYLVLILSLFLDNSFAILYLSLLFYSIFTKQKVLFALSLVLFLASIYFYGFETNGKPSGHFLDTIGVYAATFSPLLMLYFIYTLYRIAVKEKKHILWYVSFSALIFTLIFSLRQRLALEDFLPFAVICVPLMVKVFLNSYRVRLPKHRSLHKLSLGIVFATLLASFAVVIFNKSVYLVHKKPHRHFAYKYNVAKELASWLHKKDIKKVHIQDKELRLRLKFYGINYGGKKVLIRLNQKTSGANIFKLDYFFKPIARYKVITL